MATTIIYDSSNTNEYGFTTNVELGPNTEEIFNLAYDVIVNGSVISDTSTIINAITIDEYGRTCGGIIQSIENMVQSYSNKLLSMVDNTYGSDDTHKKWNPTFITSLTVNQYGQITKEPSVIDYPGYIYDVTAKTNQFAFPPTGTLVRADTFSTDDIKLSGNLITLETDENKIFDYISDLITINYNELSLYRIGDISYITCSVEIDCDPNTVTNILTDQLVPLVCNLKLFTSTSGINVLSNLTEAAIVLHHYYLNYPDDNEQKHYLMSPESQIWYNSRIKRSTSDTGGLDLIFKLSGDFSTQIYPVEYTLIYTPINGDDSDNPKDNIYNYPIYLVDESCKISGNSTVPSFNYIYAIILQYIMTDDGGGYVFDTEYVTIYKKYIIQCCANVVSLGVAGDSNYKGLFNPMTNRYIEDISDLEDFLTEYIASVLSWENYDGTSIIFYGEWFKNSNYTYEKYIDNDHTSATLAQDFNTFIMYNGIYYPEFCTFNTFLRDNGYFDGGVYEYLNNIFWYYDLLTAYLMYELVGKKPSLTMDMHVTFYNAPLNITDDICVTTNVDDDN